MQPLPRHQAAFAGTLLVFGGGVEMLAWAAIVASSFWPSLMSLVPTQGPSPAASQAAILSRWTGWLVPVGLVNLALAGGAVGLGILLLRGSGAWRRPAAMWAMAAIVAGAAAIAVAIGLQLETLEAVRVNAGAPSFTGSQRSVYIATAATIGGLVLCGPPVAMLIWLGRLARKPRG